MKSLVLACAAACLLVSPAVAATTVDDIAAAERAFDAYTAKHGYTHGFHAWSAPGALAIGPAGARPIHDILAAAIAEDPSEKDAPSLLRWWPGYAAISTAGDMGYDYGGWTNGNADDCDGKDAKALPKLCGLYFTIWQKQADGTWKWVVDTGAGPEFAAGLPPRDRLMPHRRDEFARAPAGKMTAMFEVKLYETVLNSKIKEQGADSAYQGRINIDAILADGISVPARSFIDFPAALAARPVDLTWIDDSQTVAASGDMAWTTGHTVDPEGKTAGYYVRVWQRWQPSSLSSSLSGNSDPYWAIAADIYHAAQPAAAAAP